MTRAIGPDTSVSTAKVAVTPPICSPAKSAAAIQVEDAGVLLPGYATAAQLARLRLNGLPTSKSGMIRYAVREGWTFVDQIRRGGTVRLYDVDALPADVRKAWILQQRRDALARRQETRGRPRGKSYWERNPDISDAILVIMGETDCSSSVMRSLLAVQFADLPSARYIRDHMRDLERRHPALLSSVRNPDQYKSKYKIALGRADADTSYAHECWELDTTKNDVLTKAVVDGVEVTQRLMVIGIIDRWSRRTRFQIVPSESGQSVRRALIDTIRAWGVMPAAVMTDNGAGYINKSIRSALGALGIEHRICPPGTPEGKPHVERVFGTFTRKRARLLGGFVGHSVADAQKLRAKAKKATGRALVVPHLTADDLQAILHGWVDGEYHVRRHGSLGMSPMAKWQSSPVAARAAPSEPVLKLALSALVGVRIVGKRGVMWKGASYWSPVLAAYVGKPVLVRRDEDDLGALFIFGDDGKTFIDTAVNQRASGLSEAAYARAAARDQADYMATARADYRAKRRQLDFGKVRDQLLRDEAEAAGKLVHLTPTRPHDNALVTDLETLTSNPVGAAAPYGADVEVSGAVPSSMAPDTNPTVVPLARTPAQKAAEADAIIAAADRGEGVDDAALARARTYQTTPAYRAHALMAPLYRKERT